MEGLRSRKIYAFDTHQHMTWRDLYDELRKLEETDDARLDNNITIWDMPTGEYYPTNLYVLEGDDVLPDQHLAMGIET